MKPVDLVASCWTTAGDAAPLRGDERSPHALLERVRAASAAGFRGLGLLHADLVVARDTYGYAEMRSMLAENGIVHLELEFLTDWWASGARRAASDAVREDLLEATEALGACHIKAGPELGDEPWDRELWARELARLAAEADAVGARVSLEFLPMCNVRTLSDALSIVEAAGHDNAGVLVDIWHVARTDTPLDEVAAAPAHLIAAVELDDAAAEPVGSLWDDTIDRRRLPGSGDLDVPGFVNAVRSAGWTGPWGVEIISEEHRQRPLMEAVADAYRATMNQFAIADQTLRAASR
jgi:sugar phosphate isomerase/epimerase